jgi:hypothetical protein
LSKMCWLMKNAVLFIWKRKKEFSELLNNTKKFSKSFSQYPSFSSSFLNPSEVILIDPKAFSSWKNSKDKEQARSLTEWKQLFNYHNAIQHCYLQIKNIKHFNFKLFYYLYINLIYFQFQNSNLITWFTDHTNELIWFGSLAGYLLQVGRHVPHTNAVRDTTCLPCSCLKS